MPRRKRLSGKELIRALKKAGFAVTRVQGSHHRLRHADGRVTTVPRPRSGHATDSGRRLKRSLPIGGTRSETGAEGSTLLILSGTGWTRRILNAIVEPTCWQRWKNIRTLSRR
jgi:predicted RNA binding protein YcfA (HicA-like mRNA interferase family)